MIFDLTDRVIIVTGATGVLAGSAAQYLAAQGARVVYLGRSQDKLDLSLAACLKQSPEAQALGLVADVLDRPALERVRDDVLARWGRIDGLVNGAGGNMPGATITPEKTFADLDFAAFEQVIDLNLHGTVLPSLIFTPPMMEGGRGTVENFTRWLAVDLARRTEGRVRVNAVLPGFFIGEQNRRLLTREDGSLTERGGLVIANTPFGRFGEADELHGALHYLLSDASKFVTGTILPVDGGFGAFSGV
jgi:NAD(P)-dependent dehydrogenase (short-subunit alcohol dehydrogenase family)